MKHRNRNMPQDAKILEWHGFLGFPTRIRYQLTNMEEVEWVSRQQRKRRRLPFTGRTREWWESERISQWMCVLFMIGSFAFAAGALLCFDLSLPVIVPAVIFFVGSLFFTSAAYLQFLEAINVPDTSARAQAGERIMRNILHGNQTVSTGGVPSRNSLEPSILILVPLTR